MPYDLSALQTGVATCTSRLGIEVTYRLLNVTENTAAQLAMLADEARAVDTRYLRALTRVVCQLVIRWDLTDHGVAVPISRARVADVPVEIRADVLAAIFEDARLGEPTGMPSPPPSRGTSAPASGSFSATSASKASRPRSSRSK